MLKECCIQFCILPPPMHFQVEKERKRATIHFFFSVSHYSQQLSPTEPNALCRVKYSFNNLIVSNDVNVHRG